MGWAKDTGYVPMTVDEILSSIRVNINGTFLTSYTVENFPGSNHYKFAYALAQEIAKGEVLTSEIFFKVQNYFVSMNSRIARPVVTDPGTLEALLALGYMASIKKMVLLDAGKRSVCVLLDPDDPDFAAKKLAIATKIFECTAGGVILQGDQVETIVISNGQSMDSRFVLPDIQEPLLRLTITISENNQQFIQSPEWVRARLMANIAARYRLGLNFEPEKYFTFEDAPWASEILLEYSLDGGSTWLSAVFDAAYDDLFEIDLANITIIEA